MKRSKKSVAVIALAIFGAGIAWLLSVQGARESADTRPQPIPEYETKPPIALSSASPTIVDINSSPSDGVVELQSAPTPGDASGVTLEALERERGDPTIAREAKLVIQRVLNARLDQSRYQVPAIMCHEQNCQMFSNPQVPGAENDWPPIVEEIVQELAKASIKSPETGAELKPMLQSISRGRRKDAVTVTIIWLR